MRNLVAHQVEDERLGLALTNHGDLDVGALGPFESLGNEIRAHAVSRLAIDGRDDVPGPDAGAERRGVLVRGNDEDLVGLLLDDHTHAVVAAALVFAHLGIGLGIVEIGVGIEHPEHARDGAVVDRGVGLVAMNGLGVVLFHQSVNVGEGLQAVANLALILGRLRANLALHDGAHSCAHGKEQNQGEKCPAGAWGHKRKVPPDSRCGRAPSKAAQRSLGSEYTTQLFDETGASTGSVRPK